MEATTNSKELENAIVLAILKYFYTQKLLTENEYKRILESLQKSDKYVDNNTGKNGVYVQEVIHQ